MKDLPEKVRFNEAGAIEPRKPTKGRGMSKNEDTASMRPGQ